MASTVLSICNSALIKIGASSVASLGEGSKAANLCTIRYPICQDYVLREHPWNFAIKRVILAPTTNPVPFGFTNYFQLPTDCLRVLPDDFGFMCKVVEGRGIVSNEGQINLRYIQSVTDPSLFDIHFAEALAWYLAADICYAMNQSNSQQQALIQMYVKALSRAKFLDAAESKPEVQNANLFIDSRLEGIQI